jgi:hypothetical protein
MLAALHAANAPLLLLNTTSLLSRPLAITPS